MRYATVGSTMRTIPGDGLQGHLLLGDGRPLRSPVRPLDDGTTESIRVIEFVWRVGSRVQPVLWLDRELLN